MVMNMVISVGAGLPDNNFQIMTDAGPASKSTEEIFGRRRIVLFAVPGAYTPTCHMKHLPGYMEHFDIFKSMGIDEVACLSVNDIFVLDHWSRDTDAKDKLLFLADGSCLFTKAIGLENDTTSRGMGYRSKRYSMLVEDRVVINLNIDEKRGDLSLSSAEHMLSLL